MRLQFPVTRTQQKRFYGIIFLGILTYIFSAIILDYDQTWMHPEKVNRDMGHILSTGHALNTTDLFNAMNTGAFNNGRARTRFLSTYLLIINTKLRLWLYNFMPPHPSFSITWLFTLFVSPLLLYHFLLYWTGRRYCAWAGVLLHTCSTGYLSGLAFLHHPAKPMTSVFLLLCLFIGATINRQIENEEKPNRTSRIWFVLLLLSMCFGFFLDETAVFAIPMVPLFFPKIFFRKGIIWTTSVCYLLPILFFATSIFIIVPPIHEALGFGRYSVLQYAIEENPRALNFNPLIIFRNGWFMLKEHLLYQYIPRELKWPLLFAFAGYLLYLFKLHTTKQKSRLLRALAGLGLFIVMLTLIHTKHYLRLPNSYYYGTLFSLFWVICLATWLAHPAPKLRQANLFIVLALIPMFLGNFEIASSYWINSHDRTHWVIHFPNKELDQLKMQEPLTRKHVVDLWQHRSDAEYLELMKDKLPLRAVALIKELQEHRKIYIR